MDGRMSSTVSTRQKFDVGARPLLLFAYQKCQEKRATGSRPFFRLKTALQMVKFYINLS
jgi:hypothetical protein